jgi:hypothetical protein
MPFFLLLLSLLILPVAAAEQVREPEQEAARWRLVRDRTVAWMVTQRPGAWWSSDHRLGMRTLPDRLKRLLFAAGASASLPARV